MLRDRLPEDLEAHEATLNRIIREGLGLYASRFRVTRAGMSLRSERSNVHDCLVEIAKQHSHWHLENNLFTMRFGRYVIKLKKLNARLETSNNPTQGVLDFREQGQTDLFTGEVIVNLHLGYVPDPINIRNSSVWVVCPDGASIDWVYEIPEDAAGVAVPTPMPTAPDVPPAREPRVTPKRRKVARVRKVNES